MSQLPVTPTCEDDDYRLSLLRMRHRHFRLTGISASSGHDRLPKLLAVESRSRIIQHIRMKCCYLVKVLRLGRALNAPSSLGVNQRRTIL